MSKYRSGKEKVMKLLKGVFFLALLVVALATPLRSNAQEQSNDVLAVLPQYVTSWVEIKVDSLFKVDSLAQRAAKTALDSIATEQGVSFNEEKIKYFKTYQGIWTEMEGRGRRQRAVRKGYIVRMKAMAPILKEE